VALANQTATTSAYWGDQDLQHTQYLQLAQNRATCYRQRTEAERVAMEEATRGARRAAEQRRAALVRSQELLLEHLTPEQRDTFHKNKWFLVIGGKTKTQYRIRTESYAGNIDVLEAGKVTARLCVHCSDIPLYDHHLAQKITLEYDEESLLKLANRTRVA